MALVKLSTFSGWHRLRNIGRSRMRPGLHVCEWCAKVIRWALPLCWDCDERRHEDLVAERARRDPFSLVDTGVHGDPYGERIEVLPRTRNGKLYECNAHQARWLDNEEWGWPDPDTLK